LKSHGHDVTDQQAHMILQRANVLAHGGADNVGTLRPYLAKYKEMHPDAHYVVEHHTMPAPPAAAPAAAAGAAAPVGVPPAPAMDEVFVRVFSAFAPVMRAFKAVPELIKPYITVDGAHCKRGILLTLVCSDANGNLMQMAVGVVKSETTANWTWFVQQAVVAFPQLREWRDLLTACCDGDKGADNGLDASLHYAQRVLCMKHRLRNIAKRFGSGETGTAVYNLFLHAAQAPTEAEYDVHMATMERDHKEGWLYVKERDPNTWATCFYPKRTYGKLTSNDAGVSERCTMSWWVRTCAES